MALFESYERRIDKINSVLNSYGIASIEEAEKITKDAGLNVYDQIKGIQPICFENACWAYTVGAAIAIKKGCKKAADAAAAIGEGLQAFCIPGSVADTRKVGLGHGNLGKMLLEEETECFCFLAGHESFAAAEGAIGIAEKANKVRQKPLRVILNGLGKDEEGICLTYGMPDLSESTGQGKEEEDGGSRVLQISGADFARIEKMYDQSQEKLLDMGHLQVLVMGRTLVEDGRWRMVLDYLKQESFVGEDLYVFEAEDAGEILNWHGEDNSSAGEYITGLIRNRMSGGNITAVTLRELFYEKYKEDKILRLPIAKIRNGSLEVEV